MRKVIIYYFSNNRLAAPKVDNEFCKVRWHEMSASEVFDLHRAVYSFKSIMTSFKGEQVKLLEVARSSDSSQQQFIAGHIKFLWKSKKILVGCSDGRAIEVGKLSLSKKTMSAKDFNNGFLSKISDDEKKFE